jgi:hypothetical protein
MGNLNFIKFDNLSVFKDSNGFFSVDVLRDFISNIRLEIDKIIKSNISGIENLDEFIFLNKDFIVEFNTKINVDNMIDRLKIEGVSEENLKYIEIFLEELESLCGWLDTGTYSMFYERMEKISGNMEECSKHLV